MNKFKAKDIFTLICTLITITASVIIVLTFLSTYHFINIIPIIFNSYFLLQLGICITMALWAIRFYMYRIGKERYIYSSICIIISVISLLFMINLVN